MTPPPVHDLGELERIAKFPSTFRRLWHLSEAGVVLDALPALIEVVEAGLKGEENDWDHADVVRLSAALRPFYGRTPSG